MQLMMPEDLEKVLKEKYGFETTLMIDKNNQMKPIDAIIKFHSK